MKISYDAQADTLYIRFQEGRAAKTKKVAEGLLIDLDEKGKLYGIEIVGAKHRIPLRELGQISFDLPIAEPGPA